VLDLSCHDCFLHVCMPKKTDQLAQFAQTKPMDGITAGFYLGEGFFLDGCNQNVDALFSCGLQNQKREATVASNQTIFFLLSHGLIQVPACPNP
jgi:hypothetical protein